MIWGYPYFWKHPGDKQWIPSWKHQTKDYDYCTEMDIQKSFEKSVCMRYIYYRCNDIQYCYIEIEIIKIHQYWYRYGFNVMPSNRFLHHTHPRGVWGRWSRPTCHLTWSIFWRTPSWDLRVLFQTLPPSHVSFPYSFAVFINILQLASSALVVYPMINDVFKHHVF